ncbi:hypothetical protein BCR35DRAFT_303964 [Leucosporidium creatinivorum]|uniref:Glycerophosphocholine acyltransferase 1 n=1 Tax=Leucosporidium creatinivorum TaxID=106004 RepID=A0A1Y2FG52_9BASI|nr:hypothetical protein BCR35DRAFT_303964 [Leucosporidium creatinivorum]
MATEPPQAELRQRAKTTGPPVGSTTESPPTPPSPTSRPSLSRTQTGDLPHSFDLANDEPLFSMPLLDLLVMVDAHLELWTRSLRRKAAPWRSKADKLVEESRERARNKIEEARAKVKLPRVNSEQFLSSMLEDSGVKDVLSPRDREKLERRYREVRERAKESLKKLSVKWEEEKTVRLRDKISFFFGVMNVLCSALLLGFAPTYIPLYYSAQMAAFLPLRVYAYKKRLYHYFLFDLCYAINALVLVYLWIFPGNTYLFEACYGLTLGSLGTAIATWRNSLVFHSLDKVISLAIHIFPPFVMTTIVHFYPDPSSRYPALASPGLGISTRPWRSISINMVAYLVWQLLYFRYVIVARKEKIKQGRATSFTFLINDKKRLIGKIAAKVPEQYREAAFMAGQALYTFVTLLIPIFVLFDSKFWSSVYLIILFGVSVWNGASFYLEVYGRKFEKELIALRKEFEEQQVQLSKYATPAAGGEEMSRVTSLDALGEKREEESEGSGEEIRHEDAEAVAEEKGFGEVAKPV